VVRQEERNPGLLAVSHAGDLTINYIRLFSHPRNIAVLWPVQSFLTEARVCVALTCYKRRWESCWYGVTWQWNGQNPRPTTTNPTTITTPSRSPRQLSWIL